jgi:uncharacterized protein YgbK (DUF1537 family)
MAVQIGVIADDFTGATDMGVMLARGGLRASVCVGVPAEDAALLKAEALVVALKSRTAPAAQAVAQSRAALAWLRQQDAQRFYFKYCSTFDSTDAGNIGPVADALLDDLESAFTIVCPAFPQNGRTVYQGHLFVGQNLLSESPMRDHPLTPMRDSNLVRVLSRQTRRRVGLVALATVRAGVAAVGERMQALRASGHAFAVVDAIGDDDLTTIAEAAADHVLLTGGSGLAPCLGPCYQRRGWSHNVPQTMAQLPIAGRALILAGSCSPATLAQIAVWRARHAAWQMDVERLLHDGAAEIDRAWRWLVAQPAADPVLVYASARSDARHPDPRAGHVIEQALADLARRGVDAGFARLVVAGGETSGAVVHALGLEVLTVGPEIEPGVPWTFASAPRPLAMALKSGNFGSDTFFLKALQ